MNRAHLLAFLWLRWRLRVNQFRRAGALNAVLFVLFAVAAAAGGLALLAVGFAVGLLVMPHAPPVARLLAWDGIVVAFLFFWAIGLLSDLQRSAPASGRSSSPPSRGVTSSWGRTSPSCRWLSGWA